MSDIQLEEVNRKVYRQFPELDGKKASVTNRPDGGKLFTYKGQVTLPNGKTMPRVVRVVVSEKGKILKLTSSR